MPITETDEQVENSDRDAADIEVGRDATIEGAKLDTPVKAEATSAQCESDRKAIDTRKLGDNNTAGTNDSGYHDEGEQLLTDKKQAEFGRTQKVGQWLEHKIQNGLNMELHTLENGFTKLNTVEDKDTVKVVTDNGGVGDVQAQESVVSKQTDKLLGENGINTNGIQRSDNDNEEHDKLIDVEIRNSKEPVAERNGEDIKDYRHRVLHTICVCSTMFALGWRNGLVGPTFPDLRLIMNEDLAKASLVFTAISFGGLLGSVCGGFAYDRVAKIPLFVVITCGLGLVAAVTPWCSNFYAMFIAHVLHGAFASAIDTVATSDIVVIWRGRAGSYMQAIHGVFSVGAILSPFATESFLAQKIYLRPEITEEINSTAITTSGYSNIIERSHAVPSIESNISHSFSNLSSINVLSVDGNGTVFSESGSTALIDNFIYGETRIYVPYLIATVISLFASSLYIVVTVIYGNVYKRTTKTNDNAKTEDGDHDVHIKTYFLSKKLKILFTILLAVTITLYVMAERGFTNFLMTYLITYLAWSKTEGSKASATFWITFALGRLSGICIVRAVRLSLMIMSFFTLLAFGGCMFWVAVAWDHKLLVWASIAVIGYGMSTIFASIFSWLSENVRRLTGRIASILFIFLSIGAMMFPILVGYLMDHVSLMWFVYTQVLIYFILIVCFLFTLMLFNVFKKTGASNATEGYEKEYINSGV